MGFTNANLDANKLDLGPVQVKYDGVDLGGTLGNAVVNFKYDKAELHMDQVGTTVVDRRISGMMATVTTELAQVLDKDKWKVAFPNANEVTTGTKLIQMANKVGSSDYALAKLLTLHPLNRDPSDATSDYNFPKALASEESEPVYGPTEQVRLKIVWNIYPDFGVTGYPLFTFGDTTQGLISASAAAPVAGGGNTGNGTVTGVTVSNGYTKTETITLTCVTAVANGGVFHVSGSISGSLGLATVGSAFNSPVINLTINDGATDFVVGDSFTIATTAANYV